MGLCLSQRQDGWLSCRFCRNRKRQAFCFQGTDQVRAHFENHQLGDESEQRVGSERTAKEEAPDVNEQLAKAATEEALGVWASYVPPWAREDARTRVTAEREVLPRPTPAELLLTTLLRLEGPRGETWTVPTLARQVSRDAVNLRALS